VIQHTDGKLDSVVWKEIYAFDDPTSRLINSIPEAWSNSNSPSISPHKKLPVDTRSSFSSSSSSIRNNKSFSSPTATISEEPREDITLSVYSYPPYKYYRQHHVKFQLLMIGLSLFKVGEFIAFWWLSGGPFLSLATALPWMYFFIVAVIVEVNDINNTGKLQDPDTYLDMLSGKLPRMTHAGAGGKLKIILGVPQNTRNSARWKIMWGMGVLVCLLNIILTYIVLSHESNKILSIWFSFQVLWTFVRIIVHHFAEPMNNSVERIVTEMSWSTLPSPLKYRVVMLMSALGSYLTSVHPRREIAYRTATVAPEELRVIIFHSSPRLYYPLPQDIDSFKFNVRQKNLIEININAVIGDPILSSAAWIAGTHLTPTDLYDCCIISFRISTPSRDLPPQVITIPCARVLSGTPIMFSKTWPHWQIIDKEETGFRPPGPRQFVPKYAANTGGNWCFFIPCEPGLWLFFRKNITEDVVGKHITAEVLTDIQVTAMLAKGDMNISLSHVDDIQQIVYLSEQARHILLQILVP
jgi:hypothetical protein